jgi:hypothetical protein
MLTSSNDIILHFFTVATDTLVSRFAEVDNSMQEQQQKDPLLR